jgi:hypothetical protein
MVRLALAFAFLSQEVQCFRVSESADESLNVTADGPPTNAGLPDCPCTIYDGFCSKRDLQRGGFEKSAACVTQPDTLITMPWMVQCVPSRNGGVEKYNCPKLLPVMCNPSKVQEPCDTSHLGTGSAEVCKKGFTLKQYAHLPKHCNLGTCTQPECCVPCDCKGDASDPCCEGEEDEEYDGHELTCDEKVNEINLPTQMRMAAYAMDCGFGQADVNYGSVTFALTQSGKKKICSEKCQQAPALQALPENIFAEAQELSEECDNPALKSQLSPVGIFSAAAELDRLHKMCADGTLDADGKCVGKLC